MHARLFGTLEYKYCTLESILCCLYWNHTISCRKTADRQMSTLWQYLHPPNQGCCQNWESFQRWITKSRQKLSGKDIVSSWILKQLGKLEIIVKISERFCLRRVIFKWYKRLASPMYVQQLWLFYFFFALTSSTPCFKNNRTL